MVRIRDRTAAPNPVPSAPGGPSALGVVEVARRDRAVLEGAAPGTLDPEATDRPASGAASARFPVTATGEVRRLIDQARRLYADEGRPARALSRIEQALRLRPKDAEALVLKGRILFWMDRVREAVSCYGRAIRSDPRCGEAFLERARVLYGVTQDHRRALREVQRALALAGRNRWLKVEALRLQGHILAGLDRDREAMASYRTAWKIQPKSPEMTWNLGETLLLMGRAKRAVRYFDAALKLLASQRSPDSQLLGFALGSKAEALRALGRPDQALRFVDKGLRQVKDASARVHLRALHRQLMATVRTRDAVGKPGYSRKIRDSVQSRTTRPLRSP